MHISEGVLPGWMLVTGYALTAAGTLVGVRKLSNEKVPAAALLSAVFFLASLVHVPVGVSSAHLILNGLAGILLDWVAFPIILVGLFLQAVLFQFGGITVLGVNTFNMAFPAVIAGFLAKPFVLRDSKFLNLIGSFIASFVAILGAGLLVAIELALTTEKFLTTAKLVFLIHIPIAIIEGIIIFFVISFIKKSFPDFMNKISKEGFKNE